METVPNSSFASLPPTARERGGGGPGCVALAPTWERGGGVALAPTWERGGGVALAPTWERGGGPGGVAWLEERGMAAEIGFDDTGWDT